MQTDVLATCVNLKDFIALIMWHVAVTKPGHSLFLWFEIINSEDNKPSLGIESGTNLPSLKFSIPVKHTQVLYENVLYLAQRSIQKLNVRNWCMCIEEESH